MSSEADPPKTLKGAALWLCGILLAVANFVAILDISIANVSVPNIAGALGVSTTQSTWVITSYAVAEAITVPLTGWLAARFGTVRVFTAAMVGFALTSALCGFAPNLGLLVTCRILQGICGGPLMPLSQTLLLTIFPKKLHPTALGIWAITTIIAPIMGPVTGGSLCDAFGWGAIFLVNVPIASIAGLLVWRMLAVFETPTRQHPMDFVGLGLLIVWVGALQIMLDIGRTHDWFESPLIITLGVVTVVGFVYFVIWELTEAHPVVDLKVFRHKGYSIGMAALALTIGAFFAVNVITPLWLQTVIGYTATWAGYATSLRGLTALIAAPIASVLMTKMDPRRIVCFGVIWLGLITLVLSFSSLDMSFGHIAFWLFLSGFGLPLFFVPLIAMTLAEVDVGETANASGMQNFIRTLATAIGVSLSTTIWENATTARQSDLLSTITVRYGALIQSQLARLHGITHQPLTATALFARLVERQAATLATNQIFLSCAFLYALCGLVVWLVPKPSKPVERTPAH